LQHEVAFDLHAHLTLGTIAHDHQTSTSHMTAEGQRRRQLRVQRQRLFGTLT
jgi:hypothetical protein